MSAAVDVVIKQGIDYEVALADIARRSERRAWRIAVGALVVAAGAVTACFVMLPLKSTLPFLVMADPYSGNATVARLESQRRTLSGNEALIRANVANFLRARESFDWNMIGDQDWNTVFSMAHADVSSEYRALHASSNEQAPARLYGKSRAVRIRILSIQPISARGKGIASGANVRFQRFVFDKSSGTERFLDGKVATMEYQYKSNLEMSDQMRLLNPLGFQVTAYRVDNDHSRTPPSVDGGASQASEES
ncbi:virB8 family protein [Stenotrophomonas maltophilia]|uniref:virB8 family protein n=1 Tax=Stenotrophomonas maltophilia TaxID=40324 RepID=UPI003D7E32E4